MKKTIASCINIFLVVWNGLTGFAQPGTIDPSFNPLDQGFWKGNSFNGSVQDILIQNDGKMLLSGSFTRYNEERPKYIVRLNTDGSLDATYQTGSGMDMFVNTIPVQENGKAIIGGGFKSYND